MKNALKDCISTKLTQQISLFLSIIDVNGLNANSCVLANVYTIHNIGFQETIKLTTVYSVIQFTGS